MLNNEFVNAQKQVFCTVKVRVGTFTNAQMLKWDRYSSVVMPPFPTSSMSGSGRIHEQKKITESKKTRNRNFFCQLKDWTSLRKDQWATVPSTWSSIGCPLVVLVCNRSHADPKRLQQQLHMKANVAQQANMKFGQSAMKILPVPVVLNVSCRSPTVTNARGPCRRIFLSPVKKKPWKNSPKPNQEARTSNSCFKKWTQLTIHIERRIWLDQSSAMLCSLQDTYLTTKEHKKYQKLKNLYKVARRVCSLQPDLPFLGARPGVFTVIVLQVINSLDSRNDDLGENNLRVWSRKLYGVGSLAKKHTQEAKVFASWSSCPSDPGIVWLQVRILKQNEQSWGQFSEDLFVRKSSGRLQIGEPKGLWTVTPYPASE